MKGLYELYRVTKNN